MVDRLANSEKSKVREQLLVDNARPQTFRCEVNSPYFNVPGEIVVVERGGRSTFNIPKSRGSTTGNPTSPRGGSRSTDRGGATDKDKPSTATSAGGIGALLLASFHPHAAGTFPARIVMRSASEVRVYAIEATVSAPGVSRELSFSAPARQAIFQDIPIVNNTQEEWTLKASFSGSRAFDGPGVIRVGRKSSGVYPLKYKPAWVGEEQARCRYLIRLRRIRLTTNCSV